MYFYFSCVSLVVSFVFDSYIKFFRSWFYCRISISDLEVDEVGVLLLVVLKLCF